MAIVSRKPEGSLIVVGLGITLAHLTLDSQKAIACADVVYSLATNPISHEIIQDLNPNVKSLHGCYAEGKPRPDTYAEMVEIVIGDVRDGKDVCFAIYGHPGVFAYPTHRSIAIAREEGYPAVMLPAVSAEDCIFADLGLDPGSCGCQSFEATDFVLRDRIWDPYSLLILWQVSVVGIMTLPEKDEVPPGLVFLKRRLIDAYGPDHVGILYEASCYPLCRHRADEKPISELVPPDFRPETTLVIRPLTGCPRKNKEFEKLIRWSGPVASGTTCES